MCGTKMVRCVKAVGAGSGQVPAGAHVPEAQGRALQAERGRDKGPGARNRKAAAVEGQGGKRGPSGRTGENERDPTGSEAVQISADR